MRKEKIVDKEEPMNVIVRYLPYRNLPVSKKWEETDQQNPAKILEKIKTIEIRKNIVVKLTFCAIGEANWI